MWSRLAMCIMNSNIQNSAYITLTNTLEKEKKIEKKRKYGNIPYISFNPFL